MRMRYSSDVTVLLQDFYTVGGDVFAFAMHRPNMNIFYDIVNYDIVNDRLPVNPIIQTELSLTPPPPNPRDGSSLHSPGC